MVYLWELLLPQILRHCRLKVHGVALVQAENVPSLLDPHVVVDQDEFADGLMGGTERRKSKTNSDQRAGVPLAFLKKKTYRVEHEAVDSVAGGEHHHGGAAVEGVARRHQVPAGLQGVLLGGFVVCNLKGKRQPKMSLAAAGEKKEKSLECVTFDPGAADPGPWPAPFCRWQRWFRWRPDSRCWTSRPEGRSTRCICPARRTKMISVRLVASTEARLNPVCVSTLFLHCGSSTYFAPSIRPIVSSNIRGAGKR